MPKTSIESLYQSHPELIRFQTEIGRPTKLGEALTIVGHPFAEPVDNQSLLRIALEQGLPLSDVETAERVIATTGFTTRYLSHRPEQSSSPENIVDRTTTIGAILLKETMKAKGWEDIDVFIDTSAFLPDTVNQGVLEKAGLSPDQVYTRSYRYACAGAVSAFIDCLSDPAMQNARIVIAALEPLSHLCAPEHFSQLETIAIPSIFGDAHTLLAFTPNHFHLENKQVLVQPDGGVIKVRTLYNFQETFSEPDTIPDHYRFANNGEGIFHHSDKGAFLDIPYPTNGSTISMDGMKTGFFFGDQTMLVMAELLNEYGNLNLLKELGNKNVIIHPASKPVVDRIAKLLRRNPQRFLDTPNLPFLMDKAKHSNSSSATTLNRWRYMIENDLIDPRLPMFWIAPGIGSAIAGAIGWIKE
ncbi:MAG: hypothetical protein UW26_C0003G0003 [Candidatus Collierbacteria bacterium GW2011_GWF1_44_12]|uniref:Uncharacterized protein n=1 Tax=Candidatus Collierbacteria bacterium GW2011_GWF1_44_12 TaxID=1618402 RepID=A0A0G1J5K0_9BACT|nr:MAG: hypothetical protein UW26_C0003G0003 [Candidatus Collierbacteria bacterium GW2011_GWF1_44_12]